MNNAKPNTNQSPESLIAFAIREIEDSLLSIEKVYNRTIHNLASLRYEIEQRTETDDLTHLLRRGSFLSKLEHMLADAESRDSSVQVMMIDLDHFKSINDRFGHQAGDEVLERVSLLVKQYLRPSDLAGRYGGEELIVAVECDEWNALEISDRMRLALSTAKFTLAQQTHVTASIGIASTTNFGFHTQELIAAADKALYAAKESGRDKVLCARTAA